MNEIDDAGRLEDHPFAQLAGLIFREGRTGELTLESGQRRRSVWFLGGNPVAVVSADPQDHIAQLLLEHGRITPDDAERLATLPETREALGAADYLPKDTLNWGVKSRFVSLCYDLFRWEEGDYAYRDGDPPRDLFLLKVPSHSLIFKGVGFAAQGVVGEAVPDQAVCGPGPVAPDEARYLGPDVRKLLDECRPGRSVGEALGGWDDLDQARRTLYALQCLGLVALSPAPASAQPAEPGFFFDEGFGQSDRPETEAHSGPDIGSLSPDEPESGGNVNFGLPPLDDAPGSAFDSAGAIEFPLDAPPPGGYPFDEEPSAGAFGSFGSDLNLAQGDEPPAAAEDGVRDGSKRRPKDLGFRSRLPRIAGIALGGIAAAALIGAAAWWGMSDGVAPPTPVKPPTKQPVSAPVPASPSPALAVSPDPPTVLPAPSAAPADLPSTPTAAPPLPQPSVTQPAPEPAVQTKVAAPPAAGTDRYRNALEIFRAGDLDGAAAVWESLLAEEHRAAFTVLLLTACQPETIRDAQRTLSPQPLFLVAKNVKGRACFRVCLGTFDSRDAAGRALSGLPSEFRSAGAAVKPVADVLNRDR